MMKNKHAIQCPQPSGVAVLDNGHAVAFEEYGDSSGEPWLFFHDSGSSRLECAFFHAAAKALGLRLIALDRPGIGGSSFYRADAPGLFARDALATADRLGIARFGVLSHGSGGIFGLTLAHLVPQRVQQHINLGGVPASIIDPVRKSEQKSSWWDGIAPPLVAALVQLRLHLIRRSANSYLQPLLKDSNSADLKILAKKTLRQILELDQREAIRQGSKGVAQDFAMRFRRLDFALEELQVPLAIWQGRAETPASKSESSYLLAHMPHARLYQLPFRGDYFYLQDVAAVFSRIHRHSAFGERLAA